MIERHPILRHREQREELESLNANVPALGDTKPSRIRIKQVQPEKCLLYEALSELPPVIFESPEPIFTKRGKKARIKAKKAVSCGPRPNRKRKR